MRTVPVSAISTIPHQLLTHAAAAFAERYTLADVLQWAREQRPPRTVAEIVTQDEYTHDVVVMFDGGHFLIFDAT